MTREPGGPWFVDAHVNMVIPEGWLRFLIHPAINLLLMVQILPFPPHCPQQSRENYSINCLAVAGAAWQGGTALLRQTRDINFSLWAERITAVCCEAGKCMHACNRQLIIPMTAAAGGAGKGAPTARRPPPPARHPAGESRRRPCAQGISQPMTCSQMRTSSDGCLYSRRGVMCLVNLNCRIHQVCDGWRFKNAVCFQLCNIGELSFSFSLFGRRKLYRRVSRLDLAG